MSNTGKGSNARGSRQAAELEAQRVARSVAPLTAPVPVPATLGEKGALVWEVVMDERYRTLTAAEVHIVERYCELHDRVLELKLLLADQGWGVPGSRPGMIVIHPAATVLQATEIEVRQIERVLGLGPAYRAKLAIDLVAIEDGVDRVNARRQRQAALSGGVDDPRRQGGDPDDEPVDGELV